MSNPADEHLDHALAEEFAGQADRIHALKVSNAHFRGLMEHNHDLWRQIQRIQSGQEPTSDAHLETLEKSRLKILDEIARMLAAAD